MSPYLRIFGSVLIVLAATFVARGYSRYCEARLRTLEGFLSFLLHIKGEIKRTLTTPEGFVRDFKCEELSECGFLSAVGSGEPLHGAYLSSLPKLKLGINARELLSEFFEGFGKDYAEGERIRTESYAQKLERIAESERESLPKNVKLCRALLLAGALGLIILII